MSLVSGPVSFRSVALLVAGVAACATAAVMIKASALHPVLLSALRLLLAAALLTPVYLSARRAHGGRPVAADWRAARLPALALAAHFASWAWGARITPTAQATLIVNLAPLAMPFLLHAFLSERATRRELVATGLALGAVLLLTARDALAADAAPLGNLVCLGSMLMFTLYLVLGRRHRAVPSLWLYVVPVYWQAGLLCAVFALPWAGDPGLASGREWLLVAGLAVLPTLVGHSLLNRAMRALPGQLVSLANLGQFVFAAPLAWVLFAERPPWVFAPACALIALAVWLGAGARRGAGLTSRGSGAKAR